jgi:predicted metal-binding protein
VDELSQSPTREENMLSGMERRLAGLSNSATRPISITKTYNIIKFIKHDEFIFEEVEYLLDFITCILTMRAVYMMHLRMIKRTNEEALQWQACISRYQADTKNETESNEVTQ